MKTVNEAELQRQYMAQRRSAQNAAGLFPYLMFVAIADPKTHPSHLALNGCVWRKDDPVWSAIYPPIGDGCRCRTRSLTEGQIQREKLTVLQSPELLQRTTSLGERQIGLRFASSGGELLTVWIEKE